MPNDKEIMVSVIVITYNQEKYIRQTLDSIVNQRVDFPIEVLVGDDASTDSTADIVRKYAEKYPDMVKAFCREKNLGPNRNFYDLATQTVGKYIASCEGDDYWSDICKLQKQVDFLETHREYYACATNFSFIDENGESIAEHDIPLYDRKYWYLGNSVYTLDDFNACKAPSQGATIVHRNFYLTEDASIIYTAHPFLGDITGWMLILAHGNIYRMDERTVCYRRNMHAENHSWNARMNNNPFHSYEILKYLMKLREYASEHLGISVTRESDVIKCFFRMVDNCVHYPSRARWVCLWKMLMFSDKKIHYIGVIVKALYFATIYPSIRNMNQISPGDQAYRKFDKTWSDFWKDALEKKVVLYGGGGGCFDVLDKYYDRLAVEFIVDNSERKRDNYVYGVLIKSVDALLRVDPEKTVVLVTSGIFYREIAKVLESRGFSHYYVYPLMERKRWWYKPMDWCSDYLALIKD